FGRLRLREWQRGVAAVDRAGAGKHQVLDLLLPATFQHVEETDEVAAGVQVWILGCVTHARLSGEVHYAFRPELREDLLHGLPIGDIGGEMTVPWMLAETVEAGL